MPTAFAYVMAITPRHIGAQDKVQSLIYLCKAFGDAQGTQNKQREFYAFFMFINNVLTGNSEEERKKNMGWFGLAKGLKKTIEGIVEGDVEKIAKGVVKSAIGAVTISSDEDAEDSNDTGD